MLLYFIYSDILVISCKKQELTEKIMHNMKVTTVLKAEVILSVGKSNYLAINIHHFNIVAKLATYMLPADYQMDIKGYRWITSRNLNQKIRIDVEIRNIP